jgi:hypothetical protein
VLFWAIGLVLERFAMSLSESEPEFRGLIRASLHGGIALIVIAAIAAITRNVTGWGGAAWVTATLLLVLYFVMSVASFAVMCC